MDKLSTYFGVICTTNCTATREALFSMAYGANAINSIKVKLPLPRHIYFKELSNDEIYGGVNWIFLKKE